MSVQDLVIVDGLIISNFSRSVFQDMRKGGLTAANCTCCVWENFAGTMRNIARWNKFFQDNADLITPVRTTADVAAAKRQARLALF
jgi:membrane dipeptidase